MVTMTKEQQHQLFQSIIAGNKVQKETLGSIFELLDELKAAKLIIDQMKAVSKIESMIKTLKDGQEQLNNAYLLLNNADISFNRSILGQLNKQVSDSISGSFDDFINSCEELVNHYKSNWI